MYIEWICYSSLVCSLDFVGYTLPSNSCTHALPFNSIMHQCNAIQFNSAPTQCHSIRSCAHAMPFNSCTHAVPSNSIMHPCNAIQFMHPCTAIQVLFIFLTNYSQQSTNKIAERTVDISADSTEPQQTHHFTEWLCFTASANEKRICQIE